MAQQNSRSRSFLEWFIEVLYDNNTPVIYNAIFKRELDTKRYTKKRANDIYDYFRGAINSYISKNENDGYVFNEKEYKPELDFIRDSAFVCGIFYSALFNSKAESLDFFIKRYTKKMENDDINPLKKLFLDYGRGYFTYINAIMEYISKDNQTRELILENANNNIKTVVDTMLGSQADGFLCYPFIYLDRTRKREGGKRVTKSTKKTYDYGKYIEMCFYYETILKNANEENITSFNYKTYINPGNNDEMKSKLDKKITDMEKLENRQKLQKFIASIKINRIGKSEKMPNVSSSVDAKPFFTVFKEQIKKKEKSNGRLFTKKQKRLLKYYASKELENIYLYGGTRPKRIPENENDINNYMIVQFNKILEMTENKMNETSNYPNQNEMKKWRMAYNDYDNPPEVLEGSRTRVQRSGDVVIAPSYKKRGDKEQKSKVVFYTIQPTTEDIIRSTALETGKEILTSENKIEHYKKTRDDLLKEYKIQNVPADEKGKQDKIVEVYDKYYRNSENNKKLRFYGPYVPIDPKEIKKRERDITALWKKLIYEYNMAYPDSVFSTKIIKIPQDKARRRYSYNPEEGISRAPRQQKEKEVSQEQEQMQLYVGQIQVPKNGISALLDKYGFKNTIKKREEAYNELYNLNAKNVDYFDSMEKQMYYVLYDKNNKAIATKKFVYISGGEQYDVLRDALINYKEGKIKADELYLKSFVSLSNGSDGFDALNDKFLNPRYKEYEKTREYIIDMTKNIFYNGQIWDKEFLNGVGIYEEIGNDVRDTDVYDNILYAMKEPSKIDKPSSLPSQNRFYYYSYH